MQAQMQVFAKKCPSLRKLVVNDLRHYGHDHLYVRESRNAARSRGWAKIKARGVAGAINLEWDKDQHMLVARVIAKAGNKPDDLLGIFVGYLMAYHGRRIGSINIQLQ